MRSWVLFVALTSLAGPSVAQNTVAKPNPGVIVPATKGRPAGSGIALTKRLLTVNYPDQPGIAVTIETQPAMTFTCTAGTAGGYPSKACSAATPFQQVTLRVGWAKTPKILVGVPPTMIAGPQWEGDCKGTAGDTCTLDLSQPRTVQINFNGGAIGTGVATGSKND
jgi:hypothetical protein